MLIVIHDPVIHNYIITATIMLLFIKQRKFRSEGWFKDNRSNPRIKYAKSYCNYLNKKHLPIYHEIRSFIYLQGFLYDKRVSTSFNEDVQ